MTNHELKELCLSLLKADTEEEIVEILTSKGFWDDPKLWRYYGDREDNFSIIGNQQSRPEAAQRHQGGDENRVGRPGFGRRLRALRAGLAGHVVAQGLQAGEEGGGEGEAKRQGREGGETKGAQSKEACGRSNGRNAGEIGVEQARAGEGRTAPNKKPAVLQTGLWTFIGSPHWKHSELFFEKKEYIPAVQQLLVNSRI